jgi:hypothetical protein
MSALSSVTSLLNYLDTPLVVGDPEGGAIFVNPAFERAFSTTAAAACGQPLAELFEGGGREAILGAVASVCSGGKTVKFMLKEAEGAYLGLASPIVAEDDSVGVVILLTEEPPPDARLVAIQSEIREPLDQAERAFQEILVQIGGRRDNRYRVLVERGMAGLERAKKWNAELYGLLVSRAQPRGKPAERRIDPVKVTRVVAERLADEMAEAGVGLQMLVPVGLDAASGDPTRLESTLTWLLRDRLASALPGALLTLSARQVTAGKSQGVLFSVIGESSATDLDTTTDAEAPRAPRALAEAVVELGGRLCALDDFVLGGVTSIYLDPIRAAAS